jgi:uroporphyrinogen-III decarboxylase
MYRELIWPQHRRMCDWAHQRGMKFIYHTDGDVRAFLDMFVEGGWDCIQPIEAKAGMDIRQLVPRYGRRLSFFGNVDMTVALTNDLDLVAEEVRRKLEAGMAGRGYIYHSDHSVPPQVSWKTYCSIVQLVERYGNYA